jgi:polysaccharide biosynthesis protein PelF
MRVLLVTEGTYPYANGGVSTWCHELVHALTDVEFDLLALTSDPTLAPVFPVPANVTLRNVAMWGTRSAWETRAGQAFASERQRLQGAAEPSAESLDALRTLLRETLGAQHDDIALCDAIEALYRTFLVQDMDELLRSAEVWELVRSELIDLLPDAALRNGYAPPVVTLEEVAEVRRWIAHWLTPLAGPLPETDVVHAAMAGGCTIVAVAAQRVHGAASVLTEHGIYLREVYLSEQRAEDGLTGKLVRLGFARRMTELHYATADRVAPCCEYNRRWEERYGVGGERLRTVYYGLDADRFPISDRELRDEPVIAWAGRIDPIKDVETLLRAAALVVAERPEVTFKLYGAASKESRAYEQTCLQLWRELKLESNVHFAGWSANTADAFADADVVVLTSISEAFPFSTLEALFCARPVVATAVGGVPEQIPESVGLVVPPRDAQAVADAVLELIADPTRWRERSRSARIWAAGSFGIEMFEREHRSLYEDAQEASETSTWHNGNGNGNGYGHDDENGNGSGGGGGGVAVLERPKARTTAKAKARAKVVDSSLADLAEELAERLRVPASAEGESAPLVALAEQIAERLRIPLHADEATATLESLGVTDAVAERRYGSTDTFALARTLWPRICAIAAQRTAFGIKPPRTPRAPIIDAAMRGATALAPLGAVLGVISLFAAAGWPATQLLALSAGITLALILSAGPAQAMVFRASVLIGLGQVRAADRFLLRVCTIGIAAAVLLTLALLPVTMALDIGSTERYAFAGALAVSAAVWLLTARLVAGGRAGVAGLCLFGGLVAGLGYAQITGGSRHAAFAGAAGAGVACALSLAAGGAPPNATRRIFLVPRGRLALELAPFARYGVLALLVVLAPHAGAWIAAAREASVLTAVGDFEIGTTLALIPAMLATALVAARDRRVWEIATNTQRATRAERPGVLSHALRSHHSGSLRSFLLAVTLLSLIEGAIVWLAVGSDAIEGIVTLQSNTAVAAIFVTSLFGYAALGVGQLSAGYAMGLARPQGPGRAALGGVIVGLTGSLALALLLGPGWAVGGLAAGAIAFAVLAVRATDRLLEAAAFHYATAF